MYDLSLRAFSCWQSFKKNTSDVVATLFSLCRGLAVSTPQGEKAVASRLKNPDATILRTVSG